MQNKRIRSCHKYHYDTVKICRETDVIFTRCRICKNLFPSTLEYFRKDNRNPIREIQPICRKCWCEKENEYKTRVREEQEFQNKKISNVEEHSLFEWKVFTKEDVKEEQKETLESKVDRILSYLWLGKWQSKK